MVYSPWTPFFLLLTAFMKKKTATRRNTLFSRARTKDLNWDCPNNTLTKDTFRPNTMCGCVWFSLVFGSRGPVDHVPMKAKNKKNTWSLYFITVTGQPGQSNTVTFTNQPSFTHRRAVYIRGAVAQSLITIAFMLVRLVFFIFCFCFYRCFFWLLLRNCARRGKRLRQFGLVMKEKERER